MKTFPINAKVLIISKLDTAGRLLPPFRDIVHRAGAGHRPATTQNLRKPLLGRTGFIQICFDNKNVRRELPLAFPANAKVLIISKLATAGRILPPFRDFVHRAGASPRPPTTQNLRKPLLGRPGFIQICFDVSNMRQLQKKCEACGYPFTIDSLQNRETETFNMGDAAGHFTYIEVHNGTLIEFVETHKIPVMKKLGIFINMKKRNQAKPLPDFLLKALKFNRVKL